MLEANLRTGALLTEEVFDPWVHLDAQLSLARYLALTRSSASLHLRLLRRAVAQMAPSAMTLRAFGKALDQGVFGNVWELFPSVITSSVIHLLAAFFKRNGFAENAASF